jgi:lycopene cyclase domain-containing protein
MKAIFMAPIGSIIVSAPWDYVAIRDHIWYFQKPFIVGIYILGIPFEEYLFYIFMTLLFAMITVLIWQRYGYSVVVKK